MLETAEALVQTNDGKALLCDNAIGHNILLAIDSLGTFALEDLPFFGIDAPPIGYEASLGPTPRYLDTTLSIRTPTDGYVYFVNNISTYPSDSAVKTVKIKLYESHDSELMFPWEIPEGCISEIIARIIFSPNFDGYLNNQWLFIHFESVYSFNSLSMTTTSFVCGLQIKGTGIIANKIPRILSIEAKPYISTAMRQLFDFPCPIYQSDKYVVKPPPPFQLIIDSVKYKYTIPSSSHANYTEALIKNKFKTFYNSSKSKFLSKKYKSETVQYLYWLQCLIWMEESHLLFDITQYDIYFIKLKYYKKSQLIAQDKEFKFVCELIVNGSNENRPKISMGDLVRARPVAEDLYPLNNQVCELVGVVQNYNLQSEKAIIIFKTPDVIFRAKMEEVRFHIRFTFERCGLSFVHEAILDVIGDEALQRRIFPENINASEEDSKVSDYAADNVVMEGLNERQSSAVRQIVAMVAAAQTNRPPYIIFGPPGTGKTLAVVAALTEIVARFPDRRVLVVAPSDAASDVILTRLAKYFDPSVVFRLNWWQRSVASVPVDTISYCRQFEDKFTIPDYETMLSYKIIVTTCGVSGCLRHLYLKEINRQRSLLFDVVVIDEAAQATEGESLVALSLCKPIGTMVIAGDTQQLGPIYRSPAYKDRKIFASTEERLLSSPDYSFLNALLSENDPSIETLVKSLQNGENKKNKCDNKLGIFLNQNYRSHRRIFEVSSKLFYSNSLQQCGAVDDVEGLIEWSFLPQNHNFPVLFLGIDGQQRHVIDSPSFYNTSEGNSIVEVCQSILTSKDFPDAVKEIEIGVIAAFRAQVLLIRTMLRANNLRDISVGSVEDFQGQEKRVILISTVLDNMPDLSPGEHVGLFGDHRRFNVAITRAMSLVVVVGHPLALCKDKYFRTFLDFVNVNGSYRGYETLGAIRQMLKDQKQTALGEGAFVNYYTDNIEWRVML